MARFLTQEWIDEFNAALDGVVLPLPGPDAGLAAAEGSFVVVEEIHDAPDGRPLGDPAGGRRTAASLSTRA